MTLENHCHRCGFCCKHMIVTIVSNPDLEPSKDNVELQVGDGTPCKHLSVENVCLVHDKVWYPDSHCAAHVCHIPGLDQFIKENQ